MGNRTRDLPAVPPRDPGWQVFTKIPEEINSHRLQDVQEFPQGTVRVAT